MTNDFSQPDRPIWSQMEMDNENLSNTQLPPVSTNSPDPDLSFPTRYNVGFGSYNQSMRHSMIADSQYRDLPFQYQNSPQHQFQQQYPSQQYPQQYQQFQHEQFNYPNSQAFGYNSPVYAPPNYPIRKTHRHSTSTPESVFQSSYHHSGYYNDNNNSSQNYSSAYASQQQQQARLRYNSMYSDLDDEPPRQKRVSPLDSSSASSGPAYPSSRRPLPKQHAHRLPQRPSRSPQLGQPPQLIQAFGLGSESQPLYFPAQPRPSPKLPLYMPIDNNSNSNMTANNNVSNNIDTRFSDPVRTPEAPSTPVQAPRHTSLQYPYTTPPRYNPSFSAVTTAAASNNASTASPSAMVTPISTTGTPNLVIHSTPTRSNTLNASPTKSALKKPGSTDTLSSFSPSPIPIDPSNRTSPHKKAAAFFRKGSLGRLLNPKPSSLTSPGTENGRRGGSGKKAVSFVETAPEVIQYEALTPEMSFVSNGSGSPNNNDSDSDDEGELSYSSTPKEFHLDGPFGTPNGGSDSQYYEKHFKMHTPPPPLQDSDDNTRGEEDSISNVPIIEPPELMSPTLMSMSQMHSSQSKLLGIDTGFQMYGMFTENSGNGNNYNGNNIYDDNDDDDLYNNNNYNNNNGDNNMFHSPESPESMRRPLPQLPSHFPPFSSPPPPQLYNNNNNYQKQSQQFHHANKPQFGGKIQRRLPSIEPYIKSEPVDKAHFPDLSLQVHQPQNQQNYQQQHNKPTMLSEIPELSKISEISETFSDPTVNKLHSTQIKTEPDTGPEFGQMLAQISGSGKAQKPASAPDSESEFFAIKPEPLDDTPLYRVPVFSRNIPPQQSDLNLQETQKETQNNAQTENQKENKDNEDHSFAENGGKQDLTQSEKIQNQAKSKTQNQTLPQTQVQALPQNQINKRGLEKITENVELTKLNRSDEPNASVPADDVKNNSNIVTLPDNQEDDDKKELEAKEGSEVEDHDNLYILNDMQPPAQTEKSRTDSLRDEQRVLQTAVHSLLTKNGQQPKPNRDSANTKATQPSNQQTPFHSSHGQDLVSELDSDSELLLPPGYQQQQQTQQGGSQYATAQNSARSSLGSFVSVSPGPQELTNTAFGAPENASGSSLLSKNGQPTVSQKREMLIEEWNKQNLLSRQQDASEKDVAKSATATVVPAATVVTLDSGTNTPVPRYPSKESSNGNRDTLSDCVEHSEQNVSVKKEPVEEEPVMVTVKQEPVDEVHQLHKGQAPVSNQHEHEAKHSIEPEQEPQSQPEPEPEQNVAPTTPEQKNARGPGEVPSDSEIQLSSEPGSPALQVQSKPSANLYSNPSIISQIQQTPVLLQHDFYSQMAQQRQQQHAQMRSDAVNSLHFNHGVPIAFAQPNNEFSPIINSNNPIIPPPYSTFSPYDFPPFATPPPSHSHPHPHNSHIPNNSNPSHSQPLQAPGGAFSGTGHVRSVSGSFTKYQKPQEYPNCAPNPNNNGHNHPHHDFQTVRPVSQLSVRQQTSWIPKPATPASVASPASPADIADNNGRDGQNRIDEVVHPADEGPYHFVPHVHSLSDFNSNANNGSSSSLGLSDCDSQHHVGLPSSSYHRLHNDTIEQDPKSASSFSAPHPLTVQIKQEEQEATTICTPVEQMVSVFETHDDERRFKERQAKQEQLQRKQQKQKPSGLANKTSFSSDDDGDEEEGRYLDSSGFDLNNDNPLVRKEDAARSSANKGIPLFSSHNNNINNRVPKIITDFAKPSAPKTLKSPFMPDQESQSLFSSLNAVPSSQGQKTSTAQKKYQQNTQTRNSLPSQEHDGNTTPSNLSKQTEAVYIKEEQTEDEPAVHAEMNISDTNLPELAELYVDVDEFQDSFIKSETSLVDYPSSHPHDNPAEDNSSFHNDADYSFDEGPSTIVARGTKMKARPSLISSDVRVSKLIQLSRQSSFASSLNASFIPFLTASVPLTLDLPGSTSPVATNTTSISGSASASTSSPSKTPSISQKQKQHRRVESLLIPAESSSPHQGTQTNATLGNKGFVTPRQHQPLLSFDIDDTESDFRFDDLDKEFDLMLYESVCLYFLFCVFYFNTLLNFIITIANIFPLTFLFLLLLSLLLFYFIFCNFFSLMETMETKILKAN